MSDNSFGTDFSTTTSVNYTLNESTLLSGDQGGTVSSLNTTSALSTTVDAADVSKITAHLIEKKQLLHEMDRLRIELSHKTLLAESYKAELMNKIDDLEEKLSDVTYSKHMMKAKLESQLKLKEDEANIQKRKLKEELTQITNRQKQLEDENFKLHEKAGYLRSSLFVDIDQLTDEQYVDLKSKDIEQLSLKDYVAVNFFEATQSLKVQSKSLQQQVNILTQELACRDEEIAIHQKEIDNERKGRAEQEFMAQKLIIKVEELQSRMQNKDFKSEHYDKVLCDRQDIEREVMHLRKENIALEASINSKTNENIEIQKEMQSCKQTLALLKQDKEYLNKQLTEVATKCKVFEEQVTVLNQELGKIKQDREELYEKYISVRERYKSEYEMKLRDELDVITSKTSTELDKIKNNSKEMYERENRNMRETRDNAIAEKDRALHAEQQMTSRYEQVSQEYRELKAASDSKITELQSDLKLKQFEFDRLQMLYEETSQCLKQANVDTTKYQHKLEVLNKEFYTLQASTDKQINELQSTNNDAIKKLSTYEKLEQELDDVILQAAQLENEVDAERVLFAYGYGANVPSTAKRRMQQSIHLARRVLKLERINTSLQGQLEEEKKKRDELLQELSNTTNILNEAQQPYNYLIESIRVRDSQIKSLQENNKLLEENIRELQEERDNLTEKNNKVTADLERLLNQREELGIIKNVVLNLKSHGRETPVTDTKTSSSKVKSSKYLPHSTPPSTQFTKEDPPLWYNRLKHKYSKQER